MSEPFYSDDHCTIYLGRCEDILPTLGAIDLVFTSPPYNKGDTGGNEWGRLDANGYGTHADNMADADYVAWQKDITSACWGLLPDTGCLMYQHKPIAKGLDLVLPMRLLGDEITLRQIVTWDRGSGFQRDGVHLVPCFEWVLVCAKPLWRVDRSTEDVWRVSPSADDLHPATFPIALPTRGIMCAGTLPEVVLDPFMGSGSTLQAAKSLGCKSIGIEIDEQYCEIAARRLGQEVLAFG